MRAVWILAVAAVSIAGVMSYFAYSKPDALEHSLLNYSTDANAAVAAQGTVPGNGAPLGDYNVGGVKQPFMSGGLAGIIGIVMAFVAVSFLGWALRYRNGNSGRTV
jgi:cobalt/nickel transport protein